MQTTGFKPFIDYVKTHIKGDEKGEAQVFLDRFFQALGYADGFKGAGANCEFRIRNEETHSTKFADLVWKPVVLIEMKKKGEDLSIHLQQAFSYWTQLVPDRPQYVILCNFDEFWIYNLNLNIYQPFDKIKTEDLEAKQEALTFLLPKPRKPVFAYNKEDVTEKVAGNISDVYKSFLKTGYLKRNISSEQALHYCLQMVLSMFAEDVNLLPNQIFTRIIEELSNEPGGGDMLVARSYDLIGGLFREMNMQGETPGGFYKGVDYFNGGLFDTIYPIELTKHEIEQVKTATRSFWQNVNPAIFGSIFEKALETTERHKLGAHYTHETDIKKIVDPVIVQPWNLKIDKAETLNDYFNLLTELSGFKVLDPACGSGNFLFVAFKEMKSLEKRLLSELRSKFTKPAEGKLLAEFLKNYKYVTTDQFFGIDIKPLAVEMARVTLMIAKELTWLEHREDHDNKFSPLPLDNLNNNIVCADALLEKNGTIRQWPEADAIIGNPPYQSKNKMQQEFGVEYMNRLRAAYPEIPGRADFCVYWFYRAHQHLKPGCFAGLVGTNTIRQNYSREGSLDYIVKNGGTIVNAVSSQDWSGDAAVFVSIVCWRKGGFDLPRQLYFFDAKNQLQLRELSFINSSLSDKTDVTGAKTLECNRKPKKVFQGQTHGHEGFLLPKNEGVTLLAKYPEYAEVLKPFLIGDELVSNFKSQPERFVIDFSNLDMIQAAKYKVLFEKLEKKVLPDVEKKAKDEKSGITRPNGRVAQLGIWWKMWRRREDMLQQLSISKRYVACARVTQRPIFEFISSNINPNDKVMCFAFEDDYSFGIIQSGLHWKWFLEKCTTLAETPNYNSASIWDTFPWPQNPSAAQIEAVAKAAKALRDERNRVMTENKMSLRDLYRLLEKPGKNPVRDLQDALDLAVTNAYGFSTSGEPLAQLLALNLEVAEREQQGLPVQPPGLPAWFPNPEKLVSDDCVKYEG